jgi:hypothetical protein
MSDQPPRWGEPGYVPPPKPPEPPKWGEPGYVPPPPPNWGEPGYVAPKPPPLRPWQRRALWIGLVLAVLGQLLYWVGLLWGSADCYQVFGHPGVALTGFGVSVAAILFVVPVARLWPRALPTFALVVSVLIVMNVPGEILLMLGGACW